MAINDGGPAYPATEANGANSGVPGMSLRDALAMSVKMPDEYSPQWGEVLIGERMPHDVEPVYVKINWWMRVEAAYRYRMADAMLRARSAGVDGECRRCGADSRP